MNRLYKIFLLEGEKLKHLYSCHKKGRMREIVEATDGVIVFDYDGNPIQARRI